MIRNSPKINPEATTPAHPKRIFVANFPYDVTEEMLDEKFAKFGELESCQLVKNKQGRNRGFAFLVYKKSANAVLASDEMGGKMFRGRKITVEIAAHQKKPFYSEKRVNWSRTLDRNRRNFGSALDLSDKNDAIPFGQNRNVAYLQPREGYQATYNRNFQHNHNLPLIIPANIGESECYPQVFPAFTSGFHALTNQMHDIMSVDFIPNTTFFY